MCGGTWPNTLVSRKMTGLSPRVRGNRPNVCLPLEKLGSIPACAGEPRTPAIEARHTRVYPRVCGGTAQMMLKIQEKGGLSPRVRGNLDGLDLVGVDSGSIPACAGEPHNVSALWSARWVYPRVCGGTSRQSCVSTPSAGLSPRVRGNPRRIKPSSPSTRSIPACAGEPDGRRGGGPRRRVYPRVCGGTRKAGRKSGFPRGLSPRVRGNRGRGPDDDRAAGSIPACAGEPRAWTR